VSNKKWSGENFGCSLFPFVEADQTFNEVGHGLVSTSRLLLVITRLHGLALSALEERVLQALLQVL